MALLFQRNVKVFVELAYPGVTGSSPGQGVWQIPILAGLSFSQAMNTSEVTISEAGQVQRRARLLFNDSLAPVEWSFSTYLRPNKNASNNTVAPEQVLWALLMGADAYQTSGQRFYSSLFSLFASPASPLSPNSPAGFSPSPGTTVPGPLAAINSGGLTNTFDFSASNYTSMPRGNRMHVYFDQGGSPNSELITFTDVVVDSVTIDFDIDGIATAQWSGFATQISRTSNTPSWVLGSPNAIHDWGVNTTSGLLRNRLSTVSLQRSDSSGSPTGAPSGDTYNIILTGGSLTVSNNLTYTIPEELGKVNQPIVNLAGSRSISGTMTAYYDNDVGSSRTAELWSDLTADINTVRNVHDLRLFIGGETSTPRVELRLPFAHLEIPTIGVDELLTLDMNFHGMPAGGNADATDEMTVVYVSA